MVRIGNVEVRPLGGGIGCLVMILGSILLSRLGPVVERFGLTVRDFLR